ncbi:MAG: hypothetical protein WC595_02485 [Candidatus Nanoarchaeia archaeon]
MARDIFGKIIKSDGFGRRISQKEIRKEVLIDSQRKGKAGENEYVMNATLAGYEVERTGRGSDFRITKRDIFTGKVTYSGLREIKTGNAKLSKLQKETQKRKSNYKVIRPNPWFW